MHFVGRRANLEEARRRREEESEEIRELKLILGRTIHQPTPATGLRTGNHNTLQYKKLADPFLDLDMATARKRRAAEAQYAADRTGRPVWDSSTWHSTPSALKGTRPVTPEPWARDCNMYAAGMEEGDGVKKESIDRRFIQGLAPGVNPDRPPSHVTMIEKAMAAYRQEIGSVTLSKSVPRLRHSPKKSSAKSSPEGKTELVSQPAPSERTQRIKAKSPPPADKASKAKRSPPKSGSPTTVLSLF